LADSIWKGQRNDELEQEVARRVSAVLNIELWQAWSKMDEVLTAIAARADERLEIQSNSR